MKKRLNPKLQKLEELRLALEQAVKAVVKIIEIEEDESAKKLQEQCDIKESEETKQESEQKKPKEEMVRVEEKLKDEEEKFHPFLGGCPYPSCCCIGCYDSCSFCSFHDEKKRCGYYGCPLA